MYLQKELYKIRLLRFLRFLFRLLCMQIISIVFHLTQTISKSAEFIEYQSDYYLFQDRDGELYLNVK